MKTTLINRRQWLAASATGAGAALCWSLKLPAATGFEPISFVIVSDTHLGRNGNEASLKNWRKAITEINELPGSMVLHLGDVVDSGREEQYSVYLETRKLLKKPVHEIPGNHDPVDLFTKYVVEETDRAVVVGGVRFLLFNNAHRDSHDGFITSDQNQWISEQCSEATKADQKIVICCHVPIHANKSPDRGWYVKPTNGQKEFYATQQKYADRILACFHGHFHNGIRGWRDHGTTVETLFPSVCYNQNRALKDRIEAGTATGFFVDELRPGFVLATIGDGAMTLRYKPLGQEFNGTYEAAWKTP